MNLNINFDLKMALPKCCAQVQHLGWTIVEVNHGATRVFFLGFKVLLEHTLLSNTANIGLSWHR